MAAKTRCTCDACMALLAECGDRLFDHYSRKLLVRGWAGQLTPVERAYTRAHASEAEKARRAIVGQHLSNWRAEASQSQ